MPANYTVVEAVKTGDKPDRGYGPMQTIRLKLRNEQGNERDGISWYAKATTPLPTPGSQVFGDVSQTDYGWQFKKARTGPVGGSQSRGGEDPATQRSISMQSAQRTAAMVLAPLIAQGDPKWDESDISAVLGRMADRLWKQTQDAMKDAS